MKTLIEVKDIRDGAIIVGTFKEIKEYFKIDLNLANEEDKDVFDEQNREINEAVDMQDLWDILEKQQDGMSFPFEWKEVE